MAQAVLGMSKMTPTKKVAKARFIAASITDDTTDYPLPNPTVASILTAATALETAYNNSRNKDTSMMTIFRKKRTAFNLLMVLVLAYIQQASGGDEVIIEAAGVTFKKPKSPTQLLGKVLGLSGGKGTLDGQSILKWKPLTGKKTYEIYKSVDNVVWVDAQCPCTKAGVIVTRLVSETYSWFKVAVVNSLGQGEWSDPVRVEAK